MKHTVFFLISILALYGCKSNDANNSLLKSKSIVTIDYNKNSQEFKFSTLIDSIKNVKLETNPDVLVGSVNDLCVTDSNLVFFDRKSATVYSFNWDGKFQFRISKKGKGPEEYLEISGLDINNQKQTIDVYDGTRSSIVSYSLSDGSFIDRKKFVRCARDFCSTNNGQYLTFLPDEGDTAIRGLVLYDSLGKQLKTLYPITGKWEGSLFPKYFVKSGEKRSIIIDNNICSYDDDGLHFTYSFIFENVPAWNSKTNFISKNGTPFTIIPRFFETDNWVLMDVLCEDLKWFMSIYNKKEEKVYVIKKMDFDVPLLSLNYAGVFKNCLITIAEPSQIDSTNLHKLNMAMNDNPLLQFCYLK